VRVETRHTKALLEAEQINKCDRNDARDIARMMRAGLFKPVHVGCLASHGRIRRYNDDDYCLYITDAMCCCSN
jgi:hypothetical protein